jgi:hypothetical protein
MSTETFEPCIACGAPVNDLGAGHDPGCPVMVTDTRIAADMARAAMDNRESWKGLEGYSARHTQLFGADLVQPRSPRTDAPLFLDAYLTAKHGRPIWVLED